MKQFISKHWFVLFCLLLALAVRCYRIDNPVLDWHSFRQADTASVTREYVKHGINLLIPRYQDLANIQSGKDNLEGYRMVEFPFINAILAIILRTVPSFSLEITSRVFSIIFSLFSIVTLYALTTQISGKRTGYATLIISSFLPYYIYYSRVIMPEPVMIFCSIFSLYSFYTWLKNKNYWYYSVSLISLIFALLLKPFVVFIFPIYFAMAWSIEGRKLFKNYLLYPFPVLAVLPFLWWRHWIQQFPSGIPANDWLFNGDQIRFRPAWFRWLFWERLIKLIGGYTGAILYIASLYKLQKNEMFIYGAWWAGILTYFSVIATGNVRHDYYQVLAIPIICITLARGLVIVETILSRINPLLGYIATGMILVSALLLSWQQVGGYFNVNHWEYVEAGKEVDRLVPYDAKVIAPAFGDTNFLYQTNRTGWPIGFEIDQKIKLGATHYVTTSYDDEARQLEEQYFTIIKNPKYLLLDLTKEKR